METKNGPAVLPPRIFERLVNLTSLNLGGNPGSASFVPIAKAGPDGGFDVTVGSTVTLGVEGAENGFDDPWGSNVEYTWTHEAGPTTEITLPETARPTFTPETEGTYRFSLRVRGKGTVAKSAEDVSIRVGPGTSAAPVLQSSTVNGATLTLTYDKDLKNAAPAQAGRSGAVFAALVSDGMTRSTRPVRISGARASARTVTMTMNPPIGHPSLPTCPRHRRPVELV